MENKLISNIINCPNKIEMCKTFGKIWADTYTIKEMKELVHKFPKKFITQSWGSDLIPHMIDNWTTLWFTKSLAIGFSTYKVTNSLYQDFSYYAWVRELSSHKNCGPINRKFLPEHIYEALKVLLGELNQIPLYINHNIEIFQHVARWRLNIGK